MITEIQNWIYSEQNYNTGVDLYSKYGSNVALKATFRSGLNSFTKAKLKEELASLLHSSSDEEVSKKNISTPKITQKLPKDLSQLKGKTMNDYKDMASLHQQLESDITIEERNDIALKILDMDDQVSTGFEAINYYLENDKRIELPENKGRRGKLVQKMNSTELIKSLTNIPTYINKLEKAIKETDLKPERIIKIQSMIQIYKDDLMYVKSKLKME